MTMNLSISSACSHDCAPYFRARVFLILPDQVPMHVFVLDHHHLKTQKDISNRGTYPLHSSPCIRHLNHVAEMTSEAGEAGHTVASRTVYRPDELFLLK